MCGSWASNQWFEEDIQLASISKDFQKELSDDLRFKKDKIINKLELVSRKEFEVLKKIVQKQDLIIKQLKKNKKTRKVKKS